MNDGAKVANLDEIASVLPGRRKVGTHQSCAAQLWRVRLTDLGDVSPLVPWAAAGRRHMIGCFWKIPASADFVSLHGALPEVAEFDQWLRHLVDLDHSEQWQARLTNCTVLLQLCQYNRRLVVGRRGQFT